MRFILNLPWTLVGILVGVISIPRSASFQEGALVIKVLLPYPMRIRGAALGNVVLLGPRELPNDLEHELVHVEQFARYPFIFPFLNTVEYVKHGYCKNRFEDEAYARAGNAYKPD